MTRPHRDVNWGCFRMGMGHLDLSRINDTPWAKLTGARRVRRSIAAEGDSHGGRSVATQVNEWATPVLIHARSVRSAAKLILGSPVSVCFSMLSLGEFQQVAG